MLILKTATGIKRAVNKLNAKEYVMEGFLEPGLVSYQDVDGGVCRLDKEVIDNMLPTFIGCPVTIDHVDESKEEILNGTDAAIKEKKRGQVTKAWWNAETGRYDCSFTVEGDDAEEVVRNGYSGSCAYNVTKTGPGGELHAIKYNESILGGEFEHLALVTNPRYEDCRIKLNGRIRMNSKTGEIKLNDAKCSICKKPVRTGERNPDIDYCNGHTPAEWDAVKKNAGGHGSSTIIDKLDNLYLRMEKEGWNVDRFIQEAQKIGLDFKDAQFYITNAKKNATEAGMFDRFMKSMSPAKDAEHAINYIRMQEGRSKEEAEEIVKIWQKYGRLNAKENSRIVMIDIPYRIISDAAEKKGITDAQVEQELSRKGLKSVGAGGGEASFEFYGTEQSAASAVKSVIGTMSGVTLGMIQNAQESEEFQREFAKEKKEHPELPDEEIKKIVLDHARAKEKSMKGDKWFDSKANAGAYEIGDQMFIKRADMPMSHPARGDSFTKGKYIVKVVESDEYPIGVPGWWVKIVEKKSNTITLKSSRAGVFKVGEQVTDIDGVRCTIVGEASSGEYYVVKYADGSTDRMREADINNSKKNGRVTTPDLGSVDINRLDPMEKMWFEKFSKSSSKEEALQVIINTTEGDWSQLSPQLRQRAERDTTWNRKIILKNTSPKAMAEGILQDINPAQITEQACVNWALEMGYTKAEGQQAWQIIFRELRELNSKVTLKSV